MKINNNLKSTISKIITTLILLSMLATFINVDVNKFVEIHTITNKINISNSNNDTIIEKNYKYEFTFTHLDIIDITSLPEQDEKLTNIQRIHYLENSSLYHYFNTFKFYYKIFITFTIELFSIVLLTFFFPHSPNLLITTTTTQSSKKNNNSNNNIYLKNNKRLKSKIIIYSIIIISFIPIVVIMILMLNLNFKSSLIQDCKKLIEFKLICIDDDGNTFGYCSNNSSTSIISNDLFKTQLNSNQLINHKLSINNNIYYHSSLWWKDSITFIRITLSFIHVLLCFCFLTFLIYFNLIIDLKESYKLKKQQKQQEQQQEQQQKNEEKGIELENIKNTTLEIHSKENSIPNTPFGKQSILNSSSSSIYSSSSNLNSSGIGGCSSNNTSSSSISYNNNNNNNNNNNI